MKRVLAAILGQLVLTIVFCGASVLSSCSNDDNALEPQEYTGVPLIIYDTDIGSSTDDLFALEMLYRYEDEGRCRLLVTQPDHSVSIVSEGFVTCLAQLLASGADEYSSLSGVELVRRKVKCIYLQGGVFGEAEEPDFNFAQGITFAKTFFQNWPQEVDMVFSPMEAGQDVEYTPEQVIADVSWTDAHPIKQVYMQCDCNTGQRMWDVMPVVQAVEGDALFSLSGRGTVTFTDKAQTIFAPSVTGNCRYQLPGTKEWAAQMLEKIRRANKIYSSLLDK